MKKKLFKICILVVVTSVFLSAFPAGAANDIKLQMFFSPGIMNEETGEISIDVMIKNYNIVVHDSRGKICGITFTFDYSLDGFSLKKDADGNPLVTLDDGTLIRSPGGLSVTERAPGTVSVVFLDETLQNNLIEQDGTLLRFTLVSKSPLAFWNSLRSYPLRFVPGSLGVVLYETEKKNVSRLHDVEGIDAFVGAYNTFPTLVAPSVGKTVQFTAGDAAVTVDGQRTATDAAPFLQDGVMMVPVRFLAENLNMDVFWDAATRSVGAYSLYKSLSLSVPESAIYINAAFYAFSPGPVQVGDRVYVPITVLDVLYPEASVTAADGTVTVMVP